MSIRKQRKFMESGYKILWTDHALEELEKTYSYLELNFSSKELNALSIAIDNTLKIIEREPNLFPLSDNIGIRKAVVKRYNSMYYRILDDTIQIISFFSNRQNPSKRKL